VTYSGTGTNLKVGHTKRRKSFCHAPPLF